MGFSLAVCLFDCFVFTVGLVYLLVLYQCNQVRVGRLATVFKNEIFCGLDVTDAWGRSERACARACVHGRLPVEVLNFTNDLTMPPGAEPAPPASSVCLSPYLESIPIFRVHPSLPFSPKKH